MTQFKNIILSVLMLFVFGQMAYAQNTIFTPYEGSTHSYTISGLTQGWSYSMYITANADGSGLYDDNLTGEFDLGNNLNGTVGLEGNVSTEIDWNIGAAANIYYLWFEAIGLNGCSNMRSIEIVPQVNQFDLLSENIPETNTISCPDISADGGFDNLGASSGITVLTFSVKRENGTENKLTASIGDTYDWSFKPLLSVDPNLGLTNVIITIEGTSSGVVAEDTNGNYVISGQDDEVIVTVSIENAPGETRNVHFEVTEQKELNTNLSDSEPSNDKVTHTIQVMPVINGIGGA